LDYSRSGLRREEYRFVVEDLADIASAVSDWDEDGLPPSAEAVRGAMQVLTRTAEVLPAPEISALPNGTLLMLWHGRAGFMSLELGASEYGLLVTADGKPSIRRNGTSEELQASLPAPWTVVPVSSNDFSDYSLLATRQAALESGVSSAIGQEYDLAPRPRVAITG
jgi:hypothetical protein